jgi:hypothetical protein
MGLTVHLLCNLIDNDAVPTDLTAAGVPPCAVTAVEDLNAVMIASVSYLSERYARTDRLPPGAA